MNAEFVQQSEDLAEKENRRPSMYHFLKKNFDQSRKDQLLHDVKSLAVNLKMSKAASMQSEDHSSTVYGVDNKCESILKKPGSRLFSKHQQLIGGTLPHNYTVASSSSLSDRDSLQRPLTHQLSQPLYFPH